MAEPRMNPVINRKRVHAMFTDAGMSMSALAKETLEVKIEEFINEFIMMFTEGDKIEAENFEEAYDLLVPPPSDGNEDDAPSEQPVNKNRGLTDEEVGILKEANTFRMLRDDVKKHAFALQELITNEIQVGIAKNR